jgi:hypothetical protein
MSRKKIKAPSLPKLWSEEAESGSKKERILPFRADRRKTVVDLWRFSNSNFRKTLKTSSQF